MRRRTINFLINLGEDVKYQKYSVGFLLDLSGSMQGPPMEQAKIAINNLMKPFGAGDNILSLADQVSIVTFHTTVQKVCPWVNETDFDFFREFLFGIPDMADVILRESGATALFDGMAEILTSCYNEARDENERIILIFSDGCNWGDERFTKQDVKALVEKQNNGFIINTVAVEIESKNSMALYQIVDKVPDKDYCLFKPGITEAAICNLIAEPEHQQTLIKALRASQKQARICSLYYREGNASPHGKEILQEFADLTDGVVFDAPTPEAIPRVMQELFHVLEYGEKPSIRTGLINRLKETRDIGNDEWFRVFSINSCLSENKKNWVENPTGHAIFNTLQENCKTRNEALISFRKTYTDPATDLRQLLITNLHNQGLTFGTDIQTNPFVNLVFRGNDILGTSLFQTLYDTLDSIRNDPNDILGTPVTDYHFFMVVLIDNLVHYTPDQKKMLAALFNELNSSDSGFDKVHGIFLLSERNDHFKSNPDGFKNLSRVEFEQSVIENLYNLNVNQSLAINAYLETHSARNADSSTYDRFLSTGSVSVYADRQQFSNKVAYRLCHDLLLNLYDENFKTDGDAIDREVDNFVADLGFTSMKNQVLQGDGGLNLLSRFDCPSALEDDFTTNWKELKLRYVDQSNPGLVYITRTLLNNSFIAYIKHLYFDVRNYVESCDASGTFNTLVQDRIAGLLKLKIEQLQANTDRLLHNGYLSSPKQAELWIEKLNERLTAYIENNYLHDVNNDPNYREYSNFTYRTLGLNITDDNPSTPLDLLRKKLENFPLPIATRFKYYSLAGLFTAGSLTFFFAGVLPFAGLLSLLVPLLTIVWGEYRINQNMKQLRKLINWYGMAHRHRSRRQALDFVVTQVNQMLEELKSKIKRADESVSLDKIITENLTEQDHLDLFRKALTESFPSYFNFESKSSQGLSNFHIDVTKGFYDDKDQQTDVLDEQSIEKIAGLDTISWNGFYDNLIKTRDTIERNSFPTIRLSFIPPDFNGLLSLASSKPGINLLMKLQYKEVIKDRLYYLTLLDALNDQEITELKGFLNHKTWHQSIDILINRFNDVQQIRDLNFLSLWREVGLYQVWLNEVARIIKNDKSGSEIIKSENIFKLWKKMYHSRKEFREKLLENSKNVLAFNVNDALHLWSIIQQSSNKEKLTRHIKCWSFSPLYLSNAHNSYTSYSKWNYLAEQKYLSGNLKTSLQQDFPSLLEEIKWNEYLSSTNDCLFFNHFVAIPVEDQSLLKSFTSTLNAPDFIENDKGTWSLYFLEDFREKYLKTKKQRKEFKWLFQAG